METLKQPIYAGDLLLLHGGETVNEAGNTTYVRPYMLLVTSVLDSTVNSVSTSASPPGTPDSVTVCGSPNSTDSTENVDPRPNVSSIMVRKVASTLTSMEGCWTLDGPEVYYTLKEGETMSPFVSVSADDSYLCLGDYMPSGAGVKVIANPHGRDVLTHYFRGCPWCNDLGWTGGLSPLWPEMFADCARKQACHVCMGTDFALNDKQCLDAIEDYEAMAYGIQKHRDWNVPPKWLQREKDEALASMTDRFDNIDARNQEMGRFNRPSFEEMLQNWREQYYDDVL